MMSRFVPSPYLKPTCNLHLHFAINVTMGKIIDDQKKIANWLRNVDHGQCNEGVSELGDDREVEPLTPERRQAPLPSYDEISPTSTSFSNDSVFDIQKGSNKSWTGEDPFCDDVSDVTSVNDHECHQDVRIETEKRSATALKEEDLASNFEQSSLVSYDPPSDVDEPFKNHADILCKASCRTVVPHVDSDRPRITWITSCTQCIRAGLPCSRTPPYCSRCKRNGHANTCLLHRRRFREEIDRSDAESCTTPLLLRLKGDDKDNWQEKLKMADEVRLCTSKSLQHLSI